VKSGSSSPTYTSEPRRISEPQRRVSNSEKPTSFESGITVHLPNPACEPRLGEANAVFRQLTTHARPRLTSDACHSKIGM
jgi:hypothetical protein